MNILDPFSRFLFTHLDFCAFSVDRCNATVKTISNKMKAISWLHETLKSKTTIHLKNIQNSQRQFISIRILIHSVYTDYRTIFYICFING